MEIAGGRVSEELDGDERPVGSGQGLVRVSTDQLGDDKQNIQRVW